jgi:predicted DsbA family dithiol-disulfide isomerase
MAEAVEQQAAGGQAGGPRTVRIDVWTDLVCPWCYVGQARLDEAIAAEGVDGDLRVHSFELDPSAPHAHADAPSNLDHLVQAKGMPRDQVEAMEQRIGRMAAEIDRPYVVERPMANTRALHRIVKVVEAYAGAPAAASFFAAVQGGYFAGTLDPFDQDAVIAQAVAAGAPEDAVRAAASGEDTAAEAAVAADIQQARQMGAQGVPFMVFDERMAAPGAMDIDTYRRALRQLADATEVSGS